MIEFARRVELQIYIEDMDITKYIEPYLISCSYTDNEEDKTDDLQLTLDDREGLWISDWFPEKGATIHAVAIQKNWGRDGEIRFIDCGIFEVDTIDASGFPATVNIKATSLPYTSTIRTMTNTKAWEKIRLSDIAKEIGKRHGLKVMFYSDYNPYYIRKEQIKISDIVFLQNLCKDAGINLKATSKMLVLFEEEKFEKQQPIYTIERGKSDYISYRFSSKTGDVSYGKCHVSYTNPQTGKTIEYTYTPSDGDKENDTQILEINEKVTDREDARRLAMKRLRQKNKKETTADFTIPGDLELSAGMTVLIIGWGVFSGKYIIEAVTQAFTGGFTTSLKLRKVLDGY